MTKINIAGLPPIFKDKRSYLIKWSYERGLGTELIHIDYGTNGEEWQRIKDYVETRFTWLDIEEAVYTLGGLRFVPEATLEFTEDGVEAKEV